MYEYTSTFHEQSIKDKGLRASCYMGSIKDCSNKEINIEFPTETEFREYSRENDINYKD